MSVDAPFALQVTAECRDCGASVDDPLGTLRGKVAEAEADGPAAGLVHVTSPGACVTCGGGRIAVRCVTGLDGPVRNKP